MISSDLKVVLRPSIQFTMETESGNMIPFLHILATRKGPALTTKAYRKPMILAVTLISCPVFDPRLKEELFRAYKIELLPCAKNDMTDVNVVFNLMGIASGSLYQFLINQGKEVVPKIGISLSDLGLILM